MVHDDIIPGVGLIDVGEGFAEGLGLWLLYPISNQGSI